MSRVTTLFVLVICITSACHGLLIITVITPLPAKPSATKTLRIEAGERGTIDMQMRQRDVAALDAKYTKEANTQKLKMMLCVMMLPLVVVGCNIKAVWLRSVKPPPPPAWMSQPPPDWQTPLNGIISPQREADHYAMNL